MFPVECHVLLGRSAGKVDWSISKFLETYFSKRSDLGNLEWNQHIRSVRHFKFVRHARSCWWMCDAVGSMWLIGADGTGDASSICFYGLLFERWPQLFFMITFDLDASKRNCLNKKLGQLGHPFNSPIQQQVPQLKDLFPSKESQYQIQSSLVRLVRCVTLPWNSMHCAELDLPWRNILMPRQLRRCAAVACGWF